MFPLSAALPQCLPAGTVMAPASRGGSGLTYILYGGIIILLARFEPGGMHELWYRIAPRLVRRAHAA